MTRPESTPKFRSAGDSALMVYFPSDSGDEPDPRVRQMMHAIDSEPWPGLLDAVPTRASMLVIYDPLTTSHEELKGWLMGLAGRDLPPVEPHLLEIPVLYGGDAGMDLAELAGRAGLTEQEAAEMHAAQEYSVHFLGFMPGFPYMGPVPEPLRSPRLDTPRTSVPAGSVAIADSWTGIYPVSSPGGWRLIGRTPYRLFDPRRDPPALLRPGDRVRFVPVTEAEYSHLHFQVTSVGMPEWPGRT